ncbi:MAG: hypothetical protein AVDCRST_MAG77-362, partial [uncultured Chloroflexi bacterium]
WTRLLCHRSSPGQQTCWRRRRRQGTLKPSSYGSRHTDRNHRSRCRRY